MKRAIAANAEIATREGFAPRAAFIERASPRLLDPTGNWSAPMLRDPSEGGGCVVKPTTSSAGCLESARASTAWDDTDLSLAYTHLKTYENRRAAKRIWMRKLTAIAVATLLSAKTQSPLSPDTDGARSWPPRPTRVWDKALIAKDRAGIEANMAPEFARSAAPATPRIARSSSRTCSTGVQHGIPYKVEDSRSSSSATRRLPHGRIRMSWRDGAERWTAHLAISTPTYPPPETAAWCVTANAEVSWFLLRDRVRRRQLYTGTPPIRVARYAAHVAGKGARHTRLIRR
jgi:hypothetical protein